MGPNSGMKSTQRTVLSSSMGKDSAGPIDKVPSPEARPRNPTASHRSCCSIPGDLEGTPGLRCPDASDDCRNRWRWDVLRWLDREGVAINRAVQPPRAQCLPGGAPRWRAPVAPSWHSRGRLVTTRRPSRSQAIPDRP